jgi:hypothetical protein
VHVPIQMLWLMLADIWFDGSRAFANSAVTLPIYIVIAVLIAGLAHYRFERPAGAWLRKHLS